MGAVSVDFDQPIPFYVENFLGFPAGTPVPTAYYDRAKGAWVPAPDGLVIDVLGENDGMAELDVDGDDVADAGAALDLLGITEAEREEIASLYGTYLSPGNNGIPKPPPILRTLTGCGANSARRKPRSIVLFCASIILSALRFCEPQ